ncbi:MAG: 16S rRNA (cytidine(1402)-2'-O)-methyltransferase [Rhodospirillaceae bacterium]|jgi:16S rRNA (cytidine1402-2'-O)-methyltransferase|nr:16S rRNA (cytidine(1402)-2'-O)-methyltransferase [Rhodospirillaceae bacterium]MBT4939697.1 16S rRNA (cytidine(1402)-2'-O)-methyltransferase [Rhodospirillaceae bacterium]MBT7957177.1 16S rRNA (cytidine(1402)-2'-O)-methyltransferase [Rhodospirillaceae bacterium]
MNSTLRPGLYLVATPIGNLQDLSLRAHEILSNAEVIACEDTRVTGKLLSRHTIDRPMKAYHEHNAAQARPGLLKILEEGGAVALVSDAGTPAISDPGFRLVNDCIERGFDVTAAPGANAAITGLILSGLPTDRFMFAGFLPNKTTGRKKELAELASIPATLIFYESAKRLAAALEDMAEQLGDRPACVARELTKLHEEMRRGSLVELAGHYQQAGAPKGEIVIVVGPPLKAAPLSEDEIEALILARLENKSVRDAAQEIALETGLPKRQIYARALDISKGQKKGQAS